MASERPGRPSGKSPSQHLAERYDRWALPADDTPGAPLVTALHDGADWVEIHAPRAFFEKLAEALERGDSVEVEKWLLVWAMARKEPNPNLCGAPTHRGNPCHYERPCPRHPRWRKPT